MNGISLPSSLEARLVSVVTQLPQIHFVFAGLAPVTSGNSAVNELLSIFFGLALVWLFPNVRQIMRHYKPTWEDMAGKETPAPLSSGVIAKWMTWEPKAMCLFLIGFLFFVCLSSMTSKVSEFLYFQF